MSNTRNVFEQFERTSTREPHGLAEESDPIEHPREYTAHKHVDRKQPRLIIRPAAQSWERLPYRYLLRIMENSDLGTDITLVYTFLAVVISGRNLRPIANAIDKELCVYLQQYDPARFDPPTDLTLPLIEKMVVHAAPLAGSSGESDTKPKASKREAV